VYHRPTHFTLHITARRKITVYPITCTVIYSTSLVVVAIRLSIRQQCVDKNTKLFSFGTAALYVATATCCDILCRLYHRATTSGCSRSTSRASAFIKSATSTCPSNATATPRTGVSSPPTRQSRRPSQRPQPTASRRGRA